MIKSIVKLFGLLSALALVVVGTASAADVGYVGAGSFGAAGSGNGELVSPGDIAVADGTGLVFVADTGNARVQVFEPGSGTAAYLTEIGAGVLDAPVGVAVDQATGDLYVADRGDSRIYRFTSDGAATPTFTLDASFVSPKAGSGTGRLGSFDVRIAVDATDHSLLVADRANHRISRYDGSGAFVASFDGSDIADGPLTGPVDVAADAAGKVVVIDASGEIVQGGGTSRALRFNADGTYNAAFAGVSTPGAVTIDPNTGSTLIAGNVNAFGGVRIHVYDGTTAVSDAPLPGDNSGTVAGLAVDGGATEQVYALGDWVYGCCGFVGVNILAAVALPSVTIAAPGTVTSSGASFSGMVNPNGRATGWRFETSTDGQTWTAVGADQDAGNGTAAVPVTAAATGLQPHNAYSVRLVATGDGGLVARSTAESFTTVAASPVVAAAPIGPVTATSAVVGGTVDPRNSQTRYWIEYGTDAGYGASAPAAHDGDAGSGGGATAVSQQLSGLQPDTEYHYRLVATNAAGDAVGPDRTFRTTATTTGADAACPNAVVRAQQRAEYLPDCRAFELVSPPDKAGGTINVGENTSGIGATLFSPDGSSAIFPSWFAFGDSGGVTQGNAYRATRSATGWHTTTVSPAPAETDALLQTASVYDASEDLRTAVFQVTGQFDPLDQNSSGDAYLRHDSGPMQLISRSNDAGPWTSYAFSSGGSVVGRSLDAGHVILAGDPGVVAPSAGAPQLAGHALYEYTAGRLRLVNLDDSGAVTSQCGATLAVAGPRGDGVSDDGSRIVFYSPEVGVYSDPSCAEPRRLLVRLNGTTTVDVSHSQAGTPVDPAQTVPQFLGMSRDGKRIVFSARTALTDDAPTDGGVFVYDVASEHLDFVAAADVQTIVQVSDDAQRLYYLEGVTSNLKVLDHGVDRQITQLPYGNEQLLENSAVSPDGRAFAFVSSVPVTAYDNRGVSEVYLYDLTRDAVTCLSCRPDGRAPTGKSSLGSYPSFALTRTLPGGRRRNIAPSGSVYFQTPERLVSDDANSAIDVYEYRAGRVRLISPGQSPNAATLVGVSADGSDVFIGTADSFALQDSDNGSTDIYDARVDGGFAVADPPPRCVGDACQGPSEALAAATTAASILFGGGGDPPAPDRRSAVSKAKVSVAKGSVRGTQFVVKVKVPGSGRITASGAAVRTARRVTKRSTTYSVRVSLTSKAQVTLKRKGKLRVGVKVTYAPTHGSASTASVSVTLLAPKHTIKRARSTR